MGVDTIEIQSQDALPHREESDPLVASGLYSAKIGPLFIHADHNFFQNRFTRPANTFSHQPAGNCAAKNISLYDYVDLCCLPVRQKRMEHGRMSHGHITRVEHSVQQQLRTLGLNWIDNTSAEDRSGK